jgi:hypothetical protein
VTAYGQLQTLSTQVIMLARLDWRISVMDIAKINDWLQVVGIFGVIASLLFVGMQMKQTHEIALANTYNDRASQTVDAQSTALGTPQYFSGLAKIYSGRRDELTAEEYVALEAELTVFLTIFENNYFQYEMGFLPEDHWRKNLADIECRMTEPFFSTIAESWSARESFRLVLNDSIQRGRKATNSCWVSSPEDPWPYFNRTE